MIWKALTIGKLNRGALVAGLAALAALMALPAAGLAAGPVKFGSKLNPTVQPSNSLPGMDCNSTGPCTMVQEEAYGRPDGGHLAPKSGRIRVIRVIAGGPGSFRPQIVQVQHSESTLLGDTKAKVVRAGRLLTYEGQTEANWEEDRYRVEKFKVNIPIKKGQQLALRGDVSSMIRCSSGGHNTLVFSPALRKRGPYQGATDASGCWTLMEAVIR
ncbi:MAG: hypothetical protein R2725_03900 [Solirubrobacterales bacterium]